MFLLVVSSEEPQKNFTPDRVINLSGFGVQNVCGKSMKIFFNMVCWMGTFLFLVCPEAFSQSSPKMTAHCINVGQGDATLLEFPCGAILVDAGAQDNVSANRLIQYLESFFQTRTDLNRTIKAVYITHPHKDHTYALRQIVENFTVQRFIENGQDHGSGIGNIRWVRSVAEEKHIALRKIVNSEIMAVGRNHKGLTDGVIDPLKCELCDPKITILSGQWEENPGWSETEFDNANNHSLVIRIDFGTSSFMFSGDMEEDAIESFLDYYDTGSGYEKILDVDVYHVGHHGSHNATTEEFLKALSPSMAIISCGRWNDGQNTKNRFTTWAYGHPRKSTIDLLNKAIVAKRSQAIQVNVATGAKRFYPVFIRKNIYATPWDGNIDVSATLNREYSATRNN